jgi:hypothetical protein
MARSCMASRRAIRYSWAPSWRPWRKLWVGGRGMEE